jgi:16S rRNA (guanine527-N7)-methyltransferase
LELSWLQELKISDPARDGLSKYAFDLIRFNRGQNLVSRQDSDARVSALLGEASVAALRLGRYLGSDCLDLGSGAGVPGIPVALIHPTISMCLLERRGARCDFLRREKSALGLGATTVLEADAAKVAGSPEHHRGYDCLLA